MTSTDRCLSKARWMRYPEADDQTESHLAECDVCRTRWSEMDELVRLARRLPAKAPGEVRRRHLRSELIAASRMQPAAAGRRPLLWGAAATALAAAAALVLFWAGRSAPTTTPQPQETAPLAVRVDAEPTAKFVRQTRAGSDGRTVERVELSEGVLTITTEPLSPSRELTLVTSEAEIQIDGATVEVEAVGGHLSRVRVVSGQVILQTTEGRQTFGEGQVWTATPETPPVGPPTLTEAEALPAPRKATRQAAPPPRKPRVKHSANKTEVVPEEVPPPPPVDPVEVRFREAWSHYRAGRLETAARAFGALHRDVPDHALAEDAAYWHVVSATKAGEDVTAPMRAFIRRYPGSSRAGRVRLMLARALRLAGDEAGAREQLEAALKDPSAKIRARAREAL